MPYREIDYWVIDIFRVLRTGLEYMNFLSWKKTYFKIGERILILTLLEILIHLKPLTFQHFKFPNKFPFLFLNSSVILFLILTLLWILELWILPHPSVRDGRGTWTLAWFRMLLVYVDAYSCSESAFHSLRTLV